MTKEELRLNYYLPIATAWLAAVMPTIVFAQPVQPQEYTIKLSTAEVDIVGKALGKLAYEDVALLIQKLREQIIAQQSAVSQNKNVDEK